MEILTSLKALSLNISLEQRNNNSEFKYEKIFVWEKGEEWRADHPKTQQGPSQAVSLQRRGRIPVCSEKEWSYHYQINYRSREGYNIAYSSPQPRKSFKQLVSFEKDACISKIVRSQS